MAPRPGGAYARIQDVVRQIPRGRVATYGQIAALAGCPGAARQVGYALHALPAGTAVPWHRVVNARGMVSVRAGAHAGHELDQRLRLEREGVRFDARDRIVMARHQWRRGRSAGPRPGRRLGQLH